MRKNHSAVLPVQSEMPRAELQSPTALRNAFLRGAKWWEYQTTRATMWPSDQQKAAAEAATQYPEAPSKDEAQPVDREIQDLLLDHWLSVSSGANTDKLIAETVELLNVLSLVRTVERGVLATVRQLVVDALGHGSAEGKPLQASLREIVDFVDALPVYPGQE